MTFINDLGALIKLVESVKENISHNLKALHRHQTSAQMANTNTDWWKKILMTSMVSFALSGLVNVQNFVFLYSKTDPNKLQRSKVKKNT